MDVDLKKIEELYSEGFEKYGFDSKSVGWKDKDSQLLRFKKLSEVIDNKEPQITINELGCGYGEFFNYLINEGFVVDKFYGYDISDKMLKDEDTTR